MTTTQMKVFLTAATCLNFTEAAHQLYLSQSALSRQIMALERELNVQLFLRDSRGLRLTPAGKVLLEKLTYVYNAYVEGLQEVQAAQWGISSELTIGVLDGHMVSGQLSEIVHHMELSHPNVAVTLFRGSFSTLTSALYNGTADLILTLEFSIREKEQFAFLPVSQTKDYLVMPKGHPLAERPRLAPADLKNEVIIAISREDSPTAYQGTLRLRKLCGCTRPQKDAPNLDTCTLWIQSGLGISVLNSHNYLASDPELVFFDLDWVGEPPFSSDLVAAWRRDSPNPALSPFLEELRRFPKILSPPLPRNVR